MGECTAGSEIWEGEAPAEPCSSTNRLGGSLALPPVRRIPLTSTDAIRLWLIAKSPATAAARTEPTVTLPLEEHIEAVYRYARRLTGQTDLAEDITQETLLRGWRNRRKLHEPRAARLWLLRIDTNVWTDHLRKSKLKLHGLEFEPPCPRRLPSEVSDERESVRIALAAMDELPPRQRQVLYLVTCEQLSHDEIANVLRISPSAVKSNLSLARQEMRLKLKDVYDSVCARSVCKSIDHDK
jgi:RNA polymerase sigma-70 factor (ECF subfamily)